jgi:hypothetical protein
MKQTAVEWFAKELYEKLEMKGDGKVFDDLLEQAKEMEKKNTIAFGYRCIGEVDSELGDLIYKKVPEEVYNETFKSE